MTCRAFILLPFELLQNSFSILIILLQRLQQSNIDLQKTVKSLEQVNCMYIIYNIIHTCAPICLGYTHYVIILRMFFTSQQECSSLADKLIKGQVSRAQEAEEMFIIRKELAKTRRKLLELEVKEATESNESLREESPKIVGGETAGGGDSGGGGGGRGDDGGEDGEEEEEKGEEGEVPFDCGPELMVLEDEELAEQLHVKSPDHVIRQEAEVSQSVCCSSYTTFP